jgi:hypothetical protein
LGDIFRKIAPKSFGRYFSKKSAQRQKNRPNGEISPNLVTLEQPFVATSFSINSRVYVASQMV